jgi:type IV pilus assembly protein PilV
MYKIRSNSGFTLIEIMIAMFVLAVGLLGAAGVATTVINGNALGNKITTATTLAQDKMEKIMGDSDTPASETELYNSITGYPAYKRVTTVADVIPPVAGIKTIEVVVAFSWKGTTHNVTLKTIMAK